MDAGYSVHFFGGHALEKQLRANLKPGYELTLTDSSQAQPFNANSFFGHLLHGLFLPIHRDLAANGKDRQDGNRVCGE